MRIVALSGSLRAASLHSMLLRASARLAPPGTQVMLHPLGALPLFNPDLEAADPPPVAALRTQLIAAGAVLIASPEYAHGVSGVIKNALDWMVGNESFVAKPVGVLAASPRSTFAAAALRETLTTMSAQVVPGACLTLPLLGSGVDEDGILRRDEWASALRGALEALKDAARPSAGEPAAM